MKSLRILAAGILSLPLLTVAPGALAQAAAAQPAATEADEAEGPDPADMAALNKMGQALSALKSFKVSNTVTGEDVLVSGQKLQYSGEMTMTADRPGYLKLVAKANHKEREYYFDGKTLTVYSPALGYYATVPAPATIPEMLKIGRERYGIEFPLADLFTWGTDPEAQKRIQSSFDAGPEVIQGQDCHHYAFRQDKVDWQVWIRTNGPALPCKLIITSTDDPAQPQYIAVMNWETDIKVTAADFAFTPREGAHKIELADVTTLPDKSN